MSDHIYMYMYNSESLKLHIFECNQNLEALQKCLSILFTDTSKTQRSKNVQNCLMIHYAVLLANYSYVYLTFFLLSRCISLNFLTHSSSSSISCCAKEICTLPIFSVSKQGKKQFNYYLKSLKNISQNKCEK